MEFRERRHEDKTEPIERTYRGRVKFTSFLMLVIIMAAPIIFIKFLRVSGADPAEKRAAVSQNYNDPNGATENARPIELGSGSGYFGQRPFTTESKSNGRPALMLYAGDDYVFARIDESFYALHRSSGEKVWGFRLPEADFAGVEDSMVLLVANTTLYALDLNTGAVRWQTETPLFVWNKVLL